MKEESLRKKGPQETVKSRLGKRENKLSHVDIKCNELNDK